MPIKKENESDWYDIRKPIKALEVSKDSLLLYMESNY